MTLLDDISTLLAAMTGLVLALNHTVKLLRKPCKGKRKRNRKRR